MKKIIGAIVGDTVGSTYEWRSCKSKNDIVLKQNCRFTDDTVMTIANMKWLLSEDKSKETLIKTMQEFGNKYPNAGYGGKFRDWLFEHQTEPYNSWGNGSGMRVSPVGWVFDTIEETLEYAKISAEVTHNHPEGIKGGQAIAAAVFLARNGKAKEDIKEFIQNNFGYNLNRSVDEIRPTYHFEVSCQKSVPESIIAFLESKDYEDAIKNAISLGGDADTQAAMAGAIAEAYYKKIDDKFSEFTMVRLTEEFKEIINEFSEKYLKDEC